MLIVVIAFAVLHGLVEVPVAGQRDLVADAFPQSFMVTLIGTLVPAALTSASPARWGMPLAAVSVGLPRNFVLRTLLSGVAVTLIAGAWYAPVMSHVGPATWSLHTVPIYKALSGGVIALIIMPVALHVFLSDVAVAVPAMMASSGSGDSNPTQPPIPADQSAADDGGLSCATVFRASIGATSETIACSPGSIGPALPGSGCVAIRITVLGRAMSILLPDRWSVLRS